MKWEKDVCKENYTDPYTNCEQTLSTFTPSSSSPSTISSPSPLFNANENDCQSHGSKQCENETIDQFTEFNSVSTGKTNANVISPKISIKTNGIRDTMDDTATLTNLNDTSVQNSSDKTQITQQVHYSIKYILIEV